MTIFMRPIPIRSRSVMRPALGWNGKRPVLSLRPYRAVPFSRMAMVLGTDRPVARAANSRRNDSIRPTPMVRFPPCPTKT